MADGIKSTCKGLKGVVKLQLEVKLWSWFKRRVLLLTATALRPRLGLGSFVVGVSRSHTIRHTQTACRTPLEQ